MQDEKDSTKTQAILSADERGVLNSRKDAAHRDWLRAKRRLVEIVLEPIIDETEFRYLRREYFNNKSILEGINERLQADYRARVARRNAIREARRQEAVQARWTNQTLRELTGLSGTGYTKDQLIEAYAAMGVPPEV